MGDTPWNVVYFSGLESRSSDAIVVESAKGGRFSVLNLSSNLPVLIS
jgi:hypothetical protein